MELYKKLFDTIKNIKNSKNKKRVMENTVIVIIIGIIFIIAGSTIFKGTSKENPLPVNSTVETEVSSQNSVSSEELDNEKDIEKILSQIDGAGKVSVLITYVSGKEIVPATDVKKTENSTNEKDNGGGTRNITQNDSENKVVYSEAEGGVKKPIVIKEILPQVKGVVVVADGASDSTVRENIVKAIEVLTEVAPHKISVFARSKN